jgi:hypothetical protein
MIHDEALGCKASGQGRAKLGFVLYQQDAQRRLPPPSTLLNQAYGELTSSSASRKPGASKPSHKGHRPRNEPGGSGGRI